MENDKEIFKIVSAFRKVTEIRDALNNVLGDYEIMIKKCRNTDDKKEFLKSFLGAQRVALLEELEKLKTVCRDLEKVEKELEKEDTENKVLPPWALDPRLKKELEDLAWSYTVAYARTFNEDILPIYATSISLSISDVIANKKASMENASKED